MYIFFLKLNKIIISFLTIINDFLIKQITRKYND